MRQINCDVCGNELSNIDGNGYLNIKFVGKVIPLKETDICYDCLTKPVLSFLKNIVKEKGKKV